jgi:diguanylate cyclase (GGDEF)-like protein
METIDRNGHGPRPSPSVAAQLEPTRRPDRALGDRGQTASDADQTLSDSDQTSSDSDQTSSDSDEAAAQGDQIASDRDQGAADRDLAAHQPPSAASTASYRQSRDEREVGTHDRLLGHLTRATAVGARDSAAAERDAIAAARDEGARRRDLQAEAVDRSIATSAEPLIERLERLRAQAAADRARAAADRARAATDRATAARERAHLEDQLRTAHLDELTGAYRRAMGRLAIANEVDRARRGDGRFVVAYLDIDDMKGVNDRDGHAAGDLVLQALVRIIRSRLRAFDPVVRYGGDEFICGMSGTDPAEAEERFRDIDAALQREVGCSVSFGLASLRPGETPDQLTARADEALLEGKRPVAGR